MILAAILVYLTGAACMAFGLAWAARRDPERLDPGVLPLAVALGALAVLAWPVTFGAMLVCAAYIRASR